MMKLACSEGLLRSIEPWNDADEYTKCIQAIEAIPEGARGYQLPLLLGRTYSNPAVLGDCRKRQGDDDVNQEVLAHALEIFESIRIFASFRPEKITTTTPLLRWGLTLMKGASLWDLIFTLAQ